MKMILVALALTGTADGLDADGFLQVMGEASSRLRDFAFVFKGDHIYVGPPEDLKGDPENLIMRFQGQCAWRPDGALFLETYQRIGDTAMQPMSKDRVVILGDRTERLTRQSNMLDAKPEVNVTPRATPGSFTLANSPLRIFTTWYFLNARRPKLLNFRDLGTEEIEGRPCLHIQYDELPFAIEGGVPRKHFWIDLERGGHSVRIEKRKADRLMDRTTIELAEVEGVDKERHWFPTRGVVESYNLDGRYYDKPVLINRIEVVPSSLRINQGLGDEVFGIESKRDVTDTSSLANVREEFLNPPPMPEVKTDFESVQRQLDEQLAKKDATSKRLEAEPEVGGGAGLGWVASSLATVGVLLLCGALYGWWRGR